MPSDNKTLILAEFEKYKGQLVISDNWKVERLVAVSEDEWDYYWVTYDGRDLSFHSCVGRVTPLKGYIKAENYNDMVRIAKLNHYDQVDLSMHGNMNTFLKSVDEYIIEKCPNEKFLTDFCWSLEYVNIKDIRKRKIEKVEKE